MFPVVNNNYLRLHSNRIEHFLKCHKMLEMSHLEQSYPIEGRIWAIVPKQQYSARMCEIVARLALAPICDARLHPLLRLACNASQSNYIFEGG